MESNESLGVVVNAGIDKAMGSGALAVIQSDILETESVFIAWISEENKAATNLAAVSGVPVARVRKLVRTGHFQQRFNEETERFRQAAAPYMRTRAAESIDSVVHRLESIVDKGEDKDAIGAARVLVSMVDEKQPDRVEVNTVDVRVLQVAEQGVNSLADVRRILSASIEGNIGNVEEHRSQRR